VVRATFSYNHHSVSSSLWYSSVRWGYLVPAAVTEKEKKILLDVVMYYSGVIQELPRNEQKLDVVMFGDENARRGLIKLYVQEVLIPNTEASIQQAEKNKIDMTTQLAEFKADVSDTKVAAKTQ